MAQNSAQKMTDVGQYIVTKPEREIPFEAGASISNLEISNESPTKNIVFKIRTTEPLCFVVKPNQGIIDAGKKASVTIHFVPKETVPNPEKSKFQVQVAYTELDQTQVGKLADFFQYLQKSQLHSIRMPVNMSRVPAGEVAGAEGNSQSPVKKSNPPVPTQEPNVQAKEGAPMQADSAKKNQPFAQAPEVRQQFEKAPTSDINNPSESDPDTMRNSNVFHSIVPSDLSGLQSQVAAYKNLIEKEQAKIKDLKQKIQEKNKNLSKTPGMPAAGAQANANWEDEGSSGKKFKFFHLILVAILFLFLGSYLAKIPGADQPVAASE